MPEVDREHLSFVEGVALAARRRGMRVDVEWPGRVGVHATEHYVFSTGGNGDWTTAVGRVGSDQDGWYPYEGEGEHAAPDLPELEDVNTEDAEAIAAALEEAAERLAPDAPSENPAPAEAEEGE